MPRPTKKQRVQAFVAGRGWTVIGEREWSELKASLPDISESTIRASGVPIAQPWRGLSQHTLIELETSLLEMSETYAARPGLRRYCRDQVISAKAHARFIASNHKVEEARRRLKSEMVEWMLVWLDDPAMFPAWAAMRRQRLSTGTEPQTPRFRQPE